MSKAILIIDMPNNCEECPLSKYMLDGIPENYCMTKDKEIIKVEVKPKWCPLRELPSKDTKSYFPDEYSDGYRDGYNACINEILRK